MNDIILKIKQTISKYNMINAGDSIIVAVSGGPDSICLLDILSNFSNEFKCKLIVAHYNHGLRKGEDEEETLLVKNMAKLFNLPFETETASHLNAKDSSLEEMARDARYDFFTRISEKYNADRIALGHNLNDQAETVIMRLLRGSGPSGLAGIPPVREQRFIRPLIEVTREKIMSYLDEMDLKFAIDSSNTDPRFARNSIRKNLLPLMHQYQPNLLRHLEQVANISRDDDAYINQEAFKWIQNEANEISSSNISIPLQLFKELPPSLRSRVTRCIISKIKSNLLRIDYDHIQSIYNLAQSDKPQVSIDLPNNIRIKKSYDQLYFTVQNGDEDKQSEFCYIQNKSGMLDMKHNGETILFEEMDIYGISHCDDPLWSATIDADKIDYPLTIRSFQPGDKFVPLGMKGSKKIKDFFIDQKVPLEKRVSAPIVLTNDKVICICGFRIDERFKITSDTKRIMRIAWL